ncbi:uncharacterized protein LOC111626788 [Centruroides sculpturatus]|uniref:uncharacterized protein LOC111626788 n=1 Tax=Centruroides sculpturatus TaxID=218467 RepID=UPI000C6CAC8E|nr:uncharacterized protein LOC111626788 [Centruroides sculpturatus]
MNLMCIQNGLSRQFQRLGRLIGGHPLYFIAGSLLLSIALSSGILNIQISRNADYLFTSTDGGVELDEEDYITDLKSVRQFYILDFSDSKKLEAIKQWQQQVYNFMKYYHSDVICLSYISHQVIDEEIKGFTNRLLPRIPFVVLIIAVFSFITLITNDWVKSKPWLGPSACLSAGIAITSGFGLMSYIGIEYVDFNIALCYSVLGIALRI